ncbi:MULTISPECIES: hypothetical protein [Streptomyces]|uniref:Sortase n=2 Tax=Streptomyces TaxID=1883 RepID=A0A117IVH0_9ACTN|nr:MULTISPECIES: hypothetical protein [Streptomyces]KUH36772.1 hypothetical protein ATE80_21655 [Streptomyces kanasensis]UUS35057.1 hypothetical protein NRO40_10635 [Streptomyces changanensis]
MRPRLVAVRPAAGAAAALVVALALTGPAPTALAAAPAGDPAGDGGARVTAVVIPATTAPGADVDLRVEGCAGPGGTVRSPAFVADAELSGGTGGLGGLGGTGAGGTGGVEGTGGTGSTGGAGGAEDPVDRGGGKGDGGPLYGDTTIRSGLAAGSHPLTVVCAGREHRDAGRVHVSPDPPATPHAPVRAGGGGAVAAPLTAAPSVAEQGPGARHTLVGLALAAVAAVAVAVRSTRRRREPGAD